jgi:hypothetical protein
MSLTIIKSTKVNTLSIKIGVIPYITVILRK